MFKWYYAKVHTVCFMIFIGWRDYISTTVRTSSVTMTYTRHFCGGYRKLLRMISETFAEDIGNFCEEYRKIIWMIPETIAGDNGNLCERCRTLLEIGHSCGGHQKLLKRLPETFRGISENFLLRKTETFPDNSGNFCGKNRIL